MNDKNKFGSWGLSLSLKPPIPNLNLNPLCKTESSLSTDESSPMMRLNNPLAILQRINRGVEIRPPPEVIDLEEGKVASPNSTLSTVTGKRSSGDREVISDEDEGGNRGDDGGDKKKLRLTKEQSLVLDQTFNENNTLTTDQKLALARQLNLRPRQVEVWFQNRRARTKSKLVEVECDKLKRCVETLTEQNKRLQMEVQELRALQWPPEQSLMPSNHLPTPLTMCPSCKNVSFSASSSGTTKTPAAETRQRPMMGVFHRPTPLNMSNLAATINNNRVMKSHSPSSS